MKEIRWLKGKDFDQDGDTWSKVLEGAELIGYFEVDADTTYEIETGEIQAAYLEIRPEKELVQYILFEQYPAPEDIANANIIHEDDYVGVMDWLRPTIKELREQSRMSQSQFSNFLNIPIRTIQDWEQERRTPPPYVVELIEYKIKKERLGMLRLVVAEEGKRETLMKGTLLEIVKYLQDNEEIYNWVNDDVDPNTGPIELPDLSDIETLRDLEHELSKVDLDWWALEVKEV